MNIYSSFVIRKLTPHCGSTTSEPLLRTQCEKSCQFDLWAHEPTVDKYVSNQTKTNTTTRINKERKNNTLAAPAGRSQSPWALLSCDGYSCNIRDYCTRNAWLTLVHVTSPLNLTPAYPDREKNKTKDNTNKRKDKTNNSKLVSRNFPAQLATSSWQSV